MNDDTPPTPPRTPSAMSLMPKAPSSEPKPAKFHPLDHVLGALFGTTYVLLLIRTAHTLGYARDEGFYFEAARSYARWFELFFRDPRAAMARNAVDQMWNYNHEHPAVMKSLFALSWKYLYEQRHLFVEPGTSFRFPGMVMGGLCLWLVYIMGVRMLGSRRIGIAAVCALAFMPRIFYHSHLDCFDVPVMFWWTLVTYCYWKSLRGGFFWAIVTGFAWGVALNVKFNTFLLPAVFVIHWLLTRSRQVTEQTRSGALPIPLSVLSMLTIGSATFIALWPWLWFDTGQRLGEYLGFHWNHAYYNMEFFGYNYFRPPFPRSYPYAMILFTVPAITLVCFAAGLIVRLPKLLASLAPLGNLLPSVGFLRRARAYLSSLQTDDPLGTDVLLIGAGYAILALWWKRDTPIFGGTKHWFTLYPFLALYAGVGFDACARALENAIGDRVRPAWLPGAALGALCVLSPVVQTAHSHPFGLGFYTPLTGGTPGAADLGMNRQFWGYTTGSLAEYFNTNLPSHGRVYIHDTALVSWAMLQEDGRIRDDIHAVWSIGEADLSIIHHELHMNEVDYQAWQAYQSPRLVHVVTHDGVPFVSVYQNPRSADRPR